MNLGNARFKCRPDPKVPGTEIELVEVAGWVVYGAVLAAWVVVMFFGFAAI